MAAPMQREIIRFEANTPQMVTLKWPEGKIVSGRFGDQVMYSTPDNRVMYLDLGVAEKINVLEPRAGETIGICKRRTDGQKTTWDVWLSPQSEKIRALRENPDLKLQADLTRSITAANEARYGEQADGTFAIGKPPASASSANGNPTETERKPLEASAALPAWSQTLLANTNAMVDAYAAALAYADKHGSRVKPEDVRALMTTCFINLTKGGSHAA